MTSKRTIQTFFQRAFLRYSSLGVVILCLISFAVSFLLGRDHGASDLQDTARVTAQAFRDRIVDGDIRSVEPQIAQVLQLHGGESAQILNADFKRIYETSVVRPPISPCPEIGVSCFEGFFGQARVFYPISLDVEGRTAFRYLYLERDIRMNWSYFLTVFIVSIAGYLGLSLAFFRVSKLASSHLSREIGSWSIRLRENPKDATPLTRPPFSELLPLKEALEGLNSQIESYEKTATDKAKLLILRGIAHDLLTPVSRLQLYLATLEARIDRVAHAEVFSEIQDSLTRVTQIATQVKELKESEPVAGTADLVELTEVEIKALRDSAAIMDKRLKIEVNSSHSILRSPFTQTEISRIVSNLVSNAAEASASGGTIRIEIGTKSGTPFLSVADEGCGISEKYVDRVFDPDFTMKPATGTGLGLSIVKHICERRAAHVELSSQTHKGTIVTIRLQNEGLAHHSGEVHV
ncbi:MAG: HAMP domain-containing histidine kinase [Bdellovibrionales bacterium]|nr:HAMP domain-containing histidine kinase [Bdellovibrionales bacterium]